MDNDAKQRAGTSADSPVFKSVLGDQFDDLGGVLQRHYFLRPYSNDRMSVVGVMHEVYSSRFARLLIPLMRVFGSLVPYRGTEVPVTVHYSARPDADTVHWERLFEFPGRKPFQFNSFMQPVGGNQVIEFVRFGVGMRLRVTAEDGALVFRDEGYIWQILGLNIPIPAGWLLGRAYVEERPQSQNRFTMRMELRHPLFGELFRYNGTFSLDVVRDDVAEGVRSEAASTPR